MRQTALEIFNYHYDRWSVICPNLHNDIYLVASIEEEIKHEADNYVQQLSQYGERWKVIIERDLKELCQYLVPLDDTLLFRKREEWEKEFEHDYHHVICTFIKKIRESLFRNGYEYQTELSPKTLLALTYFHWPKDDTELNEMIDFVRNHVVEIDGVELFPDASTPTPEQTPLDNSLEDVPPTNEKHTLPTSTDADTKNNGKKGRTPAPPFRNYFKNSKDADIILPILHELLDGEKGTIRAKYMIAISTVWLKESPAHQSVHNEFNHGTKDSTYETRFMRHYGDYSTLKRNAFSDDELSDVIELIKAKIDEQ